MTGRLEAHIEPAASALEITRDQWQQIKNSVENDRAHIEDIRNRLRGALGVSVMLTGLQGDAFERAIERYLVNARATERTLHDMIHELNRWTGDMRTAARDADWQVGQGIGGHIETILGFVLPDLSVLEMFTYGEAAVHEAVHRHRQNIFSLVADAEAHVMEGALQLVEGTISTLSNTLQWCGQQCSNAFRTVMDVLNHSLGLLEAVEPLIADALKDKRIGDVLKVLDKNALFEGSELGLGVLLDFGSGKDWSLYNLAKDAVGGGLGKLLTLSEGGVIAVAVVTVMQVGSSAASWGEGIAANILAAPGTILSHDLGVLSQNWGTVAKNLDVGKVLDDWGGVVVDTVVTDTVGVTSLVAPKLASESTVMQWHQRTLNDAGTAVTDTGRLGLGIEQFKVNVEATFASDTAAATNFVIQRGPFPPSTKAASSVVTSQVVHHFVELSNFITNGQLPKNAPPAYKAALIGETATMALNPF